MNILVFGYYDRSNLGDEMFKVAIKKLLLNCNLTFICIDDFFKENNKINIDNYDSIIFGGGDIINDYFYYKTLKIIKGFNKKIFALGVGIPYYGLIKKGYLDIYDHVFIRETTDLRRIQIRLGSSYGHFLPDLGFILKHNEKTIKNINESKNIATKGCNKKLNVGVFLAQSLFKYKPILFSIINLIRKITLEDGHKVSLIRFNTSESLLEDDKFFNEFIYETLSPETNNIILDNNIYNVYEMIEIMSSLDIGICMRFHSHIFATISQLPFLSIYSTRKVELFIKENNMEEWSQAIDLKNDKPLKLNYELAYKKFYKVVEKSKEIKEKELFIYNKYNFLLETNQVENLLKQKIKRPKILDQIDQFDLIEIYNECCDILKEKSNYDPRINKNISVKIKKEIAEEVGSILCFKITGIPSSIYLYGTINNIINKPYELKEMIKWIYKDFTNKFLNNYKIINSKVFSQDNFKGLHRSGWQYVVNHMDLINSYNGIILDMYLDMTFLWGNFILKREGIIPYTSPWIGFIHHTPNTEYTNNNTVELIKNPEFIKSLHTCKGIICLSNYLAKWFREKLKNYNIKIFNLYHPTIIPKEKFTKEKFLNNNNKKLINIGAWYRNPFTIYRINEKNTIFKKCSLKGKEMNNYFKIENIDFCKNDVLNNTQSNIWYYYLFEYLKTLPLNDWPDNEYINLGKESPNSKMGKAIYEHIKDLYSNVTILEYLPDNEYDKLFTENIIFLDLIDASAANTIIESIVRNTPILIKKIDPVVEYLGNDYPFYYNNIDEIPKLLNIENVLKTHNYLKNLDKEFLTIEYFMNSFINILKLID